MSRKFEMPVVEMPVFTRKMIEPKFLRQHEINPWKVRRFVTMLELGEVPPPCVVARYGDDVMPIDGHHRLSAAKIVGRLSDVWECDGEKFEDYCIAVGSHEADSAILAKYGIRK